MAASAEEGFEWMLQPEREDASKSEKYKFILKERLFLVIHAVMASKRQTPIVLNTRLWLVLSWLQLLAFVVTDSPGMPWANTVSAGAVASFLSVLNIAPLLRTAAPGALTAALGATLAFSAALSGAVAALGGALAARQNVHPIMPAATRGLIRCGALLAPFLAAGVGVAFRCDQGRWPHADAGAACLGGSHLLVLACALPASAALITVLGFAHLTMHSDALTARAQASSVANAGPLVALGASRAALAFLFVVFPTAAADAVAAITWATAGVLFAYHAYALPYTWPAHNLRHIGLSLALCWASFASMFASTHREYSSISKSTFLFLPLLPAALSSTLVWRFRIQSIFRAKADRSASQAEIRGRPFVECAALAQNGIKQDIAALQTLLHYPTHAVAQTAATVEPALASAKLAALIALRRTRAEALVVEHYIKALRLFPNSIVLLRAIARVQRDLVQSESGEMAQLVVLKTVSGSWPEQFELFRRMVTLRNAREGRRQSSRVAGGAADVAASVSAVQSRVMAEHHRAKALQAELLARKEQLAFWTALAQGPGKSSVDLHQVQQRLIDHLHIARQHYHELLHLTPESPGALRLYASFLVEVANRSDRAAHLMKAAAEIEQDADGIQPLPGEFTLMGANVNIDCNREDVVVLNASSEPETLGIVDRVNAFGTKFLGRGGNHADIVGGSINRFIPDPISSVHNHIMSGFATSGNHRVLSTQRLVLVRGIGSPYLHPAGLLLAPSESGFAAVIQPFAVSSAFLVFDARSLVITGACKRMAKLLRLRGPRTADGSVRLSALWADAKDHITTSLENIREAKKVKRSGHTGSDVVGAVVGRQAGPNLEEVTVPFTQFSRSEAVRRALQVDQFPRPQHVADGLRATKDKFRRSLPVLPVPAILQLLDFAPCSIGMLRVDFDESGHVIDHEQVNDSSSVASGESSVFGDMQEKAKSTAPATPSIRLAPLNPRKERARRVQGSKSSSTGSSAAPRPKPGSFGAPASSVAQVLSNPSESRRPRRESTATRSLRSPMARLSSHTPVGRRAIPVRQGHHGHRQEPSALLASKLALEEEKEEEEDEDEDGDDLAGESLLAGFQPVAVQSPLSPVSGAKGEGITLRRPATRLVEGDNQHRARALRTSIPPPLEVINLHTGPQRAPREASPGIPRSGESSVLLESETPSQPASARSNRRSVISHLLAVERQEGSEYGDTAPLVGSRTQSGSLLSSLPGVIANAVFGLRENSLDLSRQGGEGSQTDSFDSFSKNSFFPANAVGLPATGAQQPNRQSLAGVPIDVIAPSVAFTQASATTTRVRQTVDRSRAKQNRLASTVRLRRLYYTLSCSLLFLVALFAALDGVFASAITTQLNSLQTAGFMLSVSSTATSFLLSALQSEFAPSTTPQAAVLSGLPLSQESKASVMSANASLAMALVASQQVGNVLTDAPLVVSSMSASTTTRLAGATSEATASASATVTQWVQATRRAVQLLSVAPPLPSVLSSSDAYFSVTNGPRAIRTIFEQELFQRQQDLFSTCISWADYYMYQAILLVLFFEAFGFTSITIAARRAQSAPGRVVSLFVLARPRSVAEELATVADQTGTFTDTVEGDPSTASMKAGKQGGHGEEGERRENHFRNLRADAATALETAQLALNTISSAPATDSSESTGETGSEKSGAMRKAEMKAALSRKEAQAQLSSVSKESRTRAILFSVPIVLILTGHSIRCFLAMSTMLAVIETVSDMTTLSQLGARSVDTFDAVQRHAIAANISSIPEAWEAFRPPVDAVSITDEITELERLVLYGSPDDWTSSLLATSPTARDILLNNACTESIVPRACADYKGGLASEGGVHALLRDLIRTASVANSTSLSAVQRAVETGPLLQSILRVRSGPAWDELDPALVGDMEQLDPILRAAMASTDTVETAGFLGDAVSALVHAVKLGGFQVLSDVQATDMMWGILTLLFGAGAVVLASRRLMKRVSEAGRQARDMLLLLPDTLIDGHPRLEAAVLQLMQSVLADSQEM